MTMRESASYTARIAGLICFLCMGAPSSSATAKGEARENNPRPARVDNADVQRLLKNCAEEVGRKYREARSELLELDRECLRPMLEQSLDAAEDWGGKVAVAAIRTRMEHAQESDAFDEGIEAVLRNSRTSHAPGKPRPVMFISPDIARLGQDAKMEALILERLFKYEDPSDFRQATVRALGAIGTEQALDALIALMRAIDEPCSEIAVSVGKISRRLGDTRAMPHMVKVYRTQPHTQGTGLPEEVLESLPPWPQRAVILALLTIGGEEGLQALKDLRADETHPALRQQLEDAIMELGERLERPHSGQPERTNRDKRGNPELRDE